jgi:site-specific recombinase XerD
VCLEVQEGLRACEVVGLELGDVDVDERQLLVRVGKGGHERVLPISGETWDAMEKYLGEYPAKAGPLIRSYIHPTRAISAHYVSRLVSEWMHGAGVNDSGHALRHTMATDSLRNGAHIRDVQAALGHKSIATTQVYLPLLVHDLRSAMGGRSYRYEESPSKPGGDDPPAAPVEAHHPHPGSTAVDP